MKEYNILLKKSAGNEQQPLKSAKVNLFSSQKVHIDLNK